MLTLEVNAFVAIDVRTVAVIDESRGLTDLLLIAPSTVTCVSSGTLILVYCTDRVDQDFVGITQEHADRFALHRAR
jgi:hypothetical protein